MTEPIETETAGRADLDRRSAPAAVVAWARARALPAYLVGRWVWIRFESMPPAELRAELSRNGFRWVSRRGAWAHPCGTASRAGRGDPFYTYGAVPVRELGEAVPTGASA